MSQILEWYYFGDLVTLTAEGEDACTESVAPDKGELVAALEKKCDDPVQRQDLLKILKGEKNGTSGEPRLFDEMRLLGGIKTRKIYKWKEASKLKSLKMDLKLCNVEQVLVGPNKIVLPWPFIKGEKLKECSGYEGEKESNPKSFLQISPWMQTIEDLLDDGDNRDKFINSTNPRQFVKDYSGGKLEFPTGFGFDVNIKELIPRNATFISICGSEIHINVGVLRKTDGKDNLWALYEKWPCGAFNPKVDLREKRK